MVSLSKALTCFHATTMALICLFTEGATSLSCYSCSYSGDNPCFSITSCTAGQVCVQRVFKRYFLPSSYEMGCLDQTTCNRLQDLNTDRYCSTSPSDCTYCCSSQNCNTGMRAMSWSQTTNVFLFSIVLAVIKICRDLGILVTT